MSQASTSYSYAKPQSLDACIAELSTGGTVLAGGTDLMILIRDGLLSPTRLVDISGIKEMRGITERAGKVRLGALITFSEIIDSKLVKEKLPALYDSATNMGSPLIRNVATLGGNLCNASPASDGAPPLIVLGAEAVIAGKSGMRTIPVEQLFKGVRKTSLASDELLCSLDVNQPKHLGASFLKMGKRNALAISVVSVATSLIIEKGQIEDCKIALGAVAPVPLRASKAEAFLKGREITKNNAENLFSEAGVLSMAESRPITDVRASDDYRKKMIEVYTRRSLAISLARAGVKL